MGVQFGINIDPAATSRQLALDLAADADELGLDLISIQDHPYIGTYLDTWTLLTYLGARTARVGLLTNVADLPLRPPAMLAKAAASLDILAEGRVVLGLGAGARWDAIAGYGGPMRTPGEAVEALTEAVQVMRAPAASPLRARGSSGRAEPSWRQGSPISIESVGTTSAYSLEFSPASRYTDCCREARPRR